MKANRFIALIIAIAVAFSCVVLPAYAATDDAVLSADPDYGTVTNNSDGSITLNFGQDSVTQSGRNKKESIVTDSTYGVPRPDYFEVDSNGAAVLTLPSVDLNGTGYTNVDVTGAVLNSVSIEVKVGDTTVASNSDVYTGSWSTYKTFTSDLVTTEASGNVTLNFTINEGASSKYAGNYVYVKFYNSGAPSYTNPPATEAPATEAPTAEPDDNAYTITDAAFNENGKLSVKYTKNEGAPESAKLFAATYKDTSEAEMIDFKDVDVDNSGAQTVDIGKPETGIVKVFIWDGTDSIQPLSKTKKIAVNISNGDPIYMDTSYSFEERAADLVSRMTLEEKVSQLGYVAPAIERLGVSAYTWWKECLHGVARQGQATSFPTSLSLSNTWNRDLIYAVADVTSTEARGKNNRYNLSYYTPTINMARDPRWGRNDETYGEDPYLTGQLGGEFVDGMQGNDDKYTKIIATIKHYAANNNESYRRGGTSVMSEFNMRNYYTRVFKNVTEIVMPGAVMASYNATTVYRNGNLLYNYVPSAANSYLLNDLLRRSWGFDGCVTTDCGAGDDLIGTTAYMLGTLGSSTLESEAYVANALLNGMDIECNLSGGNVTQKLGVSAVEKGYISEEQIETSVYRLFLQRFRTGEFDDGATYQDITASVIETDENVAIAEEASEESWVLLKNDDNILPIKNDVTNVAVVGNLANKLAIGDYTGSPTKTTTPIEGIKEELGNNGIEVNYLGETTDDEKLFNVKSITLVYKDGKTKSLDLTKAENVSGMNLENGMLTDVTQTATAVIKNVNFENVVSVRAEMSTGSRIGGSLNIIYGQGGPGVASISSQATADLDTYAVCEAEYTGEDGGYNGTVDMYIAASPTALDFSVENYKAQLDAADVIIAYAGTIPKGDLGDADASESKDRSNINLPSHQAHVQSICDAYPDKTVVVMSTVGQINVEPFADKCKAILWTSYNGQTQGTALGKILTGDAVPSGRLTTTWYKNSDLSKMELSSGTTETVGGISGRYTDYDLQADGSNPGRTYQYYTGDAVYPFGYGLSYTSFKYSNAAIDKTNVDANGTVTFTVDVTNTGNTAGKEVVQLYVSHPNAGEGDIPLKQLKGFEKVELQPGETKTVTIALNVADLYLFSESEQKDVVYTGEYTAYIATNAEDVSNPKTFNVTGTLDSSLKTVKALPDGVSLNGLIEEDNTGLETVTQINSGISAVLNDESFIDLKDAAVKYESSNTGVATVDANGVVSSGLYEGVATITCTVTYKGVSVSTSYPVVNKLKIKPTAADRSEALAELQSEYNSLLANKGAYSETNWNTIETIYANGVQSINTAVTKDELSALVPELIEKLEAVVMDNLEDVYEITPVNPAYIKDGVIDYSEDGDGIPMYDEAKGTITVSNPYSGIMLEAKDENGNVIDSSNLLWQINRLDGSARKVADIDSATGELTIYGNGVIQISAVNLTEMLRGTLTVYVNMQIEGEYADDSGGADLTDSQNGSSGGGDAGSTATAWIRYNSVKLADLESFIVRYAGKNGGNVYVSLAADSSSKNLIASGALSATGGWTTWSTTELKVNNDVIYNARENGLLDEYGCADIYIQTNGLNLDYFRLNYTEINDEVPYEITGVRNQTNGGLKVSLHYRGSAIASDVILKTVTASGNTASTTVKGTGDYQISTGASEGETVTIQVTDSSGNALSEPYEQVWKEPVESTMVVYSLNSGEYDYSKFDGSVGDNTPYGFEVNGLSGYGTWTIKDYSASCTYTDVNGNEYDYSFTRSWQAGSGSLTNRCFYFTPLAPCKVTVLFYGSEEKRSMTIYQSETNSITQAGTATNKTFSLEVTDTSLPVYVYGGSSNKQLFAIIVEYYGQAETAAAASRDAEELNEDYDRPVQFEDWNGTRAVLTKNDLTGATKVWVTNIDGSLTQLDTSYFYKSDVAYGYDDEYVINKLAVYKDRLYAGCDGGLVIMFTSCGKCYQLKKPVDFDIKDMSVTDGVMYVSDGDNEAEIPMSELGGDSIEADEAYVLLMNGAVLVDVRSEEEFAEKSYEGSVNIPVDQIEEGLADYDRDTVLIFCCASGGRAATALEKAEEMGFTNVYNLGSVDKLL